MASQEIHTANINAWYESAISYPDAWKWSNLLAW